MAKEPGSHFLDELRATFSDRSGKPALSFPDATYSFGDLERRSERCALWLNGKGVGPGDRVVVAASDKRGFLAAHFGALFAGAVPIPDRAASRSTTADPFR